MPLVGRTTSPVVHCRIGSLEKGYLLTALYSLVHCRIGSLETKKVLVLKSL